MTNKKPALLAVSLMASVSLVVLPVGRSHAPMAMEPDIEEEAEEQAEQEAEEQAEQEAEEQAEQEAEEQAEQEAEEQAEQEAEEQAEQEAEEQAEQEAEEQAEEEAEEQAEQEAEEQAETEAEEQAEQEAEEQAEAEAEEQAESEAEAEAEEQAEAEAEEQAEGEAEEQAEQEAEQEAEEQAEAEAEEEAEQEAEDEAEDQAEQEAEDEAENEAEEQAEQEAEDEAEDEAEQEAEDELDEELEDEASDDADDQFEDAEDSAEDEVEYEADDAEYEAIEDDATDLASSFEASLELEGIAIDENQFEYASGEWLVLSSQGELDRMVAAGFEVRSAERIELLDQVLSRLGSPTGLADRASRNTLLAIAPDAEIEYNHLYAPQARFRRGRSGRAPLDAMPLSQRQRATRAKIGLIDTALSRSNTAFAQANVISRDFVASDNPRPINHGTAVASILVGQDPAAPGLLPRAQLYAASVFEQLPVRGSTASTAALVRALDWMVANGVKVVNMSLSGPPNRILQRAVDRAAASGVTIVAAAGNEGPNSRPLFPAAYSGVISVTALDENNRVFRLANRGRHLEFAAPGVSIRHAADANAPANSSGTSIAAPFVSTVLLLSRGRNGQLDAPELDALRAGALDLGARGRDPVYGHGLIRTR